MTEPAQTSARTIAAQVMSLRYIHRVFGAPLPTRQPDQPRAGFHAGSAGQTVAVRQDNFEYGRATSPYFSARVRRPPPGALDAHEAPLRTRVQSCGSRVSGLTVCRAPPPSKSRLAQAPSDAGSLWQACVRGCPARRIMRCLNTPASPTIAALVHARCRRTLRSRIR